MRTLLIILLLLHLTLTNDESNYAECLWSNCRTLREECGNNCYSNAKVISLKQSSAFC